ncbi:MULTISPECIES: hypothetical protein [unclassified Streptomyces]|uniref:hypothetical protein n=1 Tax=unclassified Streptomyces TaxID=2593676 RepID=UPI001B397F45|nr:MULTISPECIES: hypothetical protein [unclassified Streptomyces]MBQ0867450.1 hypothetical protein [Streptomyces sp. RK75]MBQ1122449.1 hypothetical protein [Streptomyces sp. B15]
MTEQTVAAVPERNDTLRLALNSLPHPLRRHNEELRTTYQTLRNTWLRADAVPAPPAPTGTGASSGNTVTAALRALDGHAAVLAATGNPLWEQLQDTRKATARMRRSVWAVTGERVWRKHVVPNAHWQRLWTDIAQESTRAYARLAGELAGQLERAGHRETRGAVAALRELSRTAAERSAELGQLSRKNLPAPEASAVEREMRGMRRPDLGYGLGEAGREQASQASRDIRQGLKMWADRSSLGRRLGKMKTPALIHMRKAWANLPSDDLREGPREAAIRFGELVGRTHEVREEIRKGKLGRYSAKDIAVLDAVIDAGFRHMKRLANTAPAGVDPNARAYGSVKEAQDGTLRLAGQLLAWQKSEMGQTLLTSQDKHVKALRDAWRSLPDPPTEKDRRTGTYDRWRAAEKTAAFGRAAQALWEKAEADGSFSAADKAKLKAVADGAMSHAAQMAKIPAARLPNDPAKNRAAVTEQSARQAQARAQAPVRTQTPPPARRASAKA